MAAAREEDGQSRTPAGVLPDAARAAGKPGALHARRRPQDRRWTAQHRAVEVAFDDAAAFVNANTRAELQQLQSRWLTLTIRRMATRDLRAYKALRDAMLEAHPEAFTSDAMTERHRTRRATTCRASASSVPTAAT